MMVTLQLTLLAIVAALLLGGIALVNKFGRWK